MPYVHKLGEYHIGQRFGDLGIITDIIKPPGLKAKLVIQTYNQERKEVKIKRVTRHKWQPVRG